MLGAIIGDIVGSPYEFANTSNPRFPLFSKRSSFTDDTICTIAVADALVRGSDFGETLREWCLRYPNPTGAYGGSFNAWLHFRQWCRHARVSLCLGCEIGSRGDASCYGFGCSHPQPCGGSYRCFGRGSWYLYAPHHPLVMLGFHSEPRPPRSVLRHRLV